MTALTLRLDEATYERLRVEAFEKRTTISALIRAALDAPAEQRTADRETFGTLREDFIASLASALGWDWEEAPGVPSSEDVVSGLFDALREEGLLIPADVIRAETLETLLSEVTHLEDTKHGSRDILAHIIGLARDYRETTSA